MASPATDVITDDAWLKGDFIASVQQRGAAIIKARGSSSAASAANAVVDTVRSIVEPTAAGDWHSVCICSDGSYGIEKDIICSFPIRSNGQKLEIVQGLPVNEFSRQKIDATVNELKEERSLVSELLPSKARVPPDRLDMKALSRAELAAFLDHTLLAPTATREQVVTLCAEARHHSFHGVCVYGSRVDLAYAQLEDTGIKVTALIGFPFGASDSDAKRYKAEVAVDQGAHEIECVPNLGRLKDGDHAGVLREMRDIAEAADERPVKIIWEPGILTDDEERTACELALDSGVQFVSMGTGLGPAITSLEVLRLRTNVGKKFGIKAAGKIRDTLTALELIEAGANRLGAMDSVAIVEGLEAMTGPPAV